MGDIEQQVADVVEPYLDRHLATLPDLACQIVALFTPEIERLRAENEALRRLFLSPTPLLELQAKADRADELQALINAWAAAADWSWVPGDPTNALAAAEDALLAAATKEDDRG